jgi:hypothetical protein
VLVDFEASVAPHLKRLLVRRPFALLRVGSIKALIKGVMAASLMSAFFLIEVSKHLGKSSIQLKRPVG